MNIEKQQLTKNEVYQKILEVYKGINDDTITAYKAQTLLSYLKQMIIIAEDWEFDEIQKQIEMK